MHYTPPDFTLLGFIPLTDSPLHTEHKVSNVNPLQSFDQFSSHLVEIATETQLANSSIGILTLLHHPNLFIK